MDSPVNKTLPFTINTDIKNEAADSPESRSEGGEDVTELCRKAASMLGPNEMIHDPEFSLYGAMSALELMDARIDKAPPALEVQ